MRRQVQPDVPLVDVQIVRNVDRIEFTAIDRAEKPKLADPEIILRGDGHRQFDGWRRIRYRGRFEESRKRLLIESQFHHATKGFPGFLTFLIGYMDGEGTGVIE